MALATMSLGASSSLSSYSDMNLQKLLALTTDSIDLPSVSQPAPGIVTGTVTYALEAVQQREAVIASQLE